MPTKCCVPNCRGNYKNGPQVSTFTFPKSEDLKRKWLAAIKRIDFEPSPNSRVCELHFSQADIERETTYFHEKSGRLLTAPLSHPRLKQEIHSLPKIKLKFPAAIDNLNQIEEILHETKQFLVDKNNDSKSVDESIQLINDILLSLINRLPEKEPTIKFLIEQVNFLSVCVKTRFRYTWETILFCGLLYSISPHAYRFLRSCGHLNLPCASTIRRVCGTYFTDPRTEQNENCFLKYISAKFSTLEDTDKLITVMLDEVHLKPYMDYKGGNIVGQAYNSLDAATSAFVFMIRSITSNYKDVAHILPVKTLHAQALHEIIKKIVIGLEKIGFEVIVAVSDNNPINKKAMSFFTEPPSITNCYPHPMNSARPLFFLIDPVHILKCIRNNWLNVKPDQNIMYPNFLTDSNSTNEIFKIASFNALKQLHALEYEKLLKYGYTLSLKALFPSSLERQNVKLALQVFNHSVVVALNELGPKRQFDNFVDTSTFIGIICKWWDVVNVKTLWKGKRLRNELAEPITKTSTHILEYLQQFLEWLQRWKKMNTSAKLTPETQCALETTTDGLIKLSNYCLTDKNLTFFLCGKIQTDKLEERFGKYRQMAGGQYKISIRQVFESENKLRMQSITPLILKSKTYGEFQITPEDPPDEVFRDTNEDPLVSVTLITNCLVSDDDLNDIDDNTWPVLVYVAGYASYAINKKLKCSYCKVFLVTDDLLSGSSVITASSRGGLCYPTTDVVTCLLRPQPSLHWWPAYCGPFSFCVRLCSNQSSRLDAFSSRRSRTGNDRTRHIIMVPAIADPAIIIVPAIADPAIIIVSAIADPAIIIPAIADPAIVIPAIVEPAIVEPL
ncbi:hypothetical protein Zmor_006075 [Zophobas morio]|uniref:THAP-type domain-containing protein n=1 Tax=Zophobas morio TaxID=2755281 RepID=A0AA38MN14_9CUCU|nr:hypothetical protein Zmor_006075 [Zophobas morio]